MLRVKDKVRLSRRNDGITRWVRVATSASLALVLTYIITSALNLSIFVKYPVMIILCVIMSVLVSFRPRWVLTVICVLIFFIGILLIILAQNKEVIMVIGWDPGLLGAGASIVAIAIAVYTLLVQIGQREENLNGGEKKISGLKNGYLWLEETKKYRCEYCNHSGRYHYFKTLSGIKGHIAKKHV